MALDTNVYNGVILLHLRRLSKLQCPQVGYTQGCHLGDGNIVHQHLLKGLIPRQEPDKQLPLPAYQSGI